MVEGDCRRLSGRVAAFRRYAVGVAVTSGLLVPALVTIPSAERAEPLAAAPSSAVPLGSYTVVPLGPGFATAVSQHSPPQVTGYEITSNDDYIGWYWKDGNLTYINDQSTWDVITTGVNDSGDVVGSDGGNAFIWSDGTMSWLPRPEGDDGGADGINDAGVISGGVDTVNVWTGPDHKFRALTAASGDWGTDGPSSGEALSSNGWVVGDATTNTAGKCLNHGSALRPEVWSPSGATTIIDEPPVSTYCTYAHGLGINDKAVVVGEDLGHLDSAGDYVDRGAAEWSGGSERLLPQVSGESADDSFALGINDDGDVVGFAGLTHDDGFAAVLWPASGGVVNLNSLLPKDSSWVLQEATAINDEGDIIGWGVYKGDQEGFVLEPSTCKPGKIDIKDYGYSDRLPGGDLKVTGKDWDSSCGQVHVTFQEANREKDIGDFDPPTFDSENDVFHACTYEVTARQPNGVSDVAKGSFGVKAVGRMLFAKGTLDDDGSAAAVQSGDPLCKTDVAGYTSEYRSDGDFRTFIDYLRSKEEGLEGLSVVMSGSDLPKVQVTFGRNPAVAVKGAVLPNDDAIPDAPEDCHDLPQVGSDEKITGTECIKGDAHYQKLTFDNGLLWVAGNLDVTGSIDGTGEVLVTGNVTSKKANFYPNYEGAILAGGTIDLGIVKLGS